MLRTARGNEPKMVLPEGKTCGDCVHFPRCKAIFGHVAADEVCDFFPSRFQAMPDPFDHYREYMRLMTLLDGPTPVGMMRLEWEAGVRKQAQEAYAKFTAGVKEWET